MPNHERNQPSNAREIKEVVTRDEPNLEAKAKQMGLHHEAPRDIQSIPKASERMIEREAALEAPSLDTLMAGSVDRQWDEFSKRLADGAQLRTGESINMPLPPGHNIVVTRTDQGLVTLVDNDNIQSEIARRLMEQRSAEINEAMRRRIREEEMRREAMKREGKAKHDAAREERRRQEAEEKKRARDEYEKVR